MTQVTVKQLAFEVKTPVERLLQQMREAGLPHTAADEHVTDSEKQSLLTHLKSSHKAKVEEPRKITLQRKTTSTLRVAGSKSISVEVRKKKVFVQRSPEEIEAERKRELDERRAVENAARQKAEEEAKRRAEEEARRQPAAAPSAPAEAVAAPAPVAEPADRGAGDPVHVVAVELCLRGGAGPLPVRGLPWPHRWHGGDGSGVLVAGVREAARHAPVLICPD